jgi:hypothetical protein
VRLREPSESGGIDFKAELIDEYADLDAAPGGFQKLVHEQSAARVVAPDECLNQDAFAAVAEEVKSYEEGIVGFLEDADFVFPFGRNPPVPLVDGPGSQRVKR